MRVVAEKRNARRVGNRVLKGLVAHNLEHVPGSRFRRYVLSLRGKRGELLGGLVAESSWNGFYVHLIWVEESLRGAGGGRELMRAAERTARKSGCDLVWLSTYSWQAPRFYEKLGYRRFAGLNGFPRGQTRYFYVKRIRRTRRPV